MADKVDQVRGVDHVGSWHALAVLVSVIGGVTWLWTNTSQQTIPKITETGYRIDINRATVGQFQALPSLGPKLSQRIIDHRRQHGDFQHVSQLQRVPGVGPVMLRQLSAYLMVSEPSTPQPSPASSAITNSALTSSTADGPAPSR
ncbi:MAG: helix-hairpin-helix domain-containing protein [Pirellulaceae bacterium]|nr:helix-hairpin-helix domain-containing protein [Pirellulaceae bacterium]